MPYLRAGDHWALGTSARRSRKDTNKNTIKSLTSDSGANCIRDISMPVMVQIRRTCGAQIKEINGKL